jgi:hypothetical protein
MGYLSVWKVLDQMIADFRKKGATIPDKVMNDLKSARTVLHAVNTPQGSGEALEKIDAYLANVESFLVSEGEKRFGKQYGNKWLKKINEASRRADEEKKEAERFVQGFPREHKWIRVKPSEDLPLEKLKTLANRSNVSYKSQDDGYLLVHGKDQHLKGFVKKMTAKHASKPKK